MRALYFDMVVPGGPRTLKKMGMGEEDVRRDVRFLLGRKSGNALVQYLHCVAFWTRKPLVEEIKAMVKHDISRQCATPPEKRKEEVIKRGILANAIGELELFERYLYDSIAYCIEQPSITAQMWASHVGTYYPSTDRIQDIKERLLNADARQELMRLAMSTLGQISLFSSSGRRPGSFLHGAMDVEREEFTKILEECVEFFEKQGTMKTRKELALMYMAYLYLKNGQAANEMLKRLRLPKPERFFEAEAAGDLAQAEKLLWNISILTLDRIWKATAFYDKHAFLSEHTNGHIESFCSALFPEHRVDMLLNLLIYLNTHYPKGNPELKKEIPDRAEHINALWLVRLANAFKVDPTDIGTMKAICVLREMQRYFENQTEKKPVVYATSAMG